MCVLGRRTKRISRIDYVTETLNINHTLIDMIQSCYSKCYFFIFLLFVAWNYERHVTKWWYSLMTQSITTTSVKSHLKHKPNHVQNRQEPCIVIKAYLESLIPISLPEAAWRFSWPQPFAFLKLFQCDLSFRQIITSRGLFDRAHIFCLPVSGFYYHELGSISVW